MHGPKNRIFFNLLKIKDLFKVGDWHGACNSFFDEL